MIVLCQLLFEWIIFRNVDSSKYDLVEKQREEIVELRARLVETDKSFFVLLLIIRMISLLQTENSRKDKHIEEMEGDLKTVNEVQNMENLQYLRHTLVKFLCYSTPSEQQMILPAVAQLLKMK